MCPYHMSTLPFMRIRLHNVWCYSYAVCRQPTPNTLTWKITSKIISFSEIFVHFSEMIDRACEERFISDTCEKVVE